MLPHAAREPVQAWQAPAVYQSVISVVAWRALLRCQKKKGASGIAAKLEDVGKYREESKKRLEVLEGETNGEAEARDGGEGACGEQSVVGASCLHVPAQLRNHR